MEAGDIVTVWFERPLSVHQVILLRPEVKNHVNGWIVQFDPIWSRMSREVWVANSNIVDK